MQEIFMGKPWQQIMYVWLSRKKYTSLMVTRIWHKIYPGIENESAMKSIWNLFSDLRIHNMKLIYANNWNHNQQSIQVVFGRKS